jgi:uncharacterized membrane protein
MAYVMLKLVHVLSVIIWIGGMTALWSVAIRLGKAGNRATLAALLPTTMRYLQFAAAPASLLVLITGIIMIVLARLGPALWVQLGFAGIVVLFVLGATLVRRNWMQLGRLVSASPADEARLAVAVRQVRLTTWAYLLLSAAVIVIMVLKPTR